MINDLKEIQIDILYRIIYRGTPSKPINFKVILQGLPNKYHKEYLSELDKLHKSGYLVCKKSSNNNDIECEIPKICIPEVVSHLKMIKGIY